MFVNYIVYGFFYFSVFYYSELRKIDTRINCTNYLLFSLFPKRKFLFYKIRRFAATGRNEKLRSGVINRNVERAWKIDVQHKPPCIARTWTIKREAYTSAKVGTSNVYDGKVPTAQWWLARVSDASSKSRVRVGRRSTLYTRVNARSFSPCLYLPYSPVFILFGHVLPWHLYYCRYKRYLRYRCYPRV